MDTNNWKKTFRDIYKPLLGSMYEEFEEALVSPKYKHFRINLNRNINYFSELDDICTFKSLDGYSNIYKVIKGDKELVNSVSFQTGGLYIMNPSSIIPTEILISFMPEYPVILDVSSAPGGKTCAISDMIKRKGIIIANEISSSRLKSLHFNLEKYGCYNVKTLSMDGRILNKFLKNSCDGILLDAPCSNENKIFRDKTVQSQWSKEFVLKMSELQKHLIVSAFDCLKEGGILVYSTCTLSIEENEKVVEHLLKIKDNAKIIKIRGDYHQGLSGISHIDDGVIRVFPSKDSIDGFFVSVISKGVPSIANNNVFNNSNNNKSIINDSFIKKYFRTFPKDINIFETEGKGYIQSSMILNKGLKYRRRGLNFYKITGKLPEIASQALWEFGSMVQKGLKTDISYNDALDYLKGFDLTPRYDYNSNLLFYKDIPIGYTKFVDNRCKNKIDRYFLYGKNISW